MNNPLVPVILCGGSGKRLWPLSRSQRPKQFLSLDGGDKSLLRETAERLTTFSSWENLFVVVIPSLAKGVQDNLPDLPIDNILVEPAARDTAAAIAWATLEIVQRLGEDVIVGFFPSDHWIKDRVAFQETITTAAHVAYSERAIVSLGVQPTFPATVYGYIEHGEKVSDFNGFSSFKVSRFLEKPNLETATEFLSSNRFSWNSGMFIFPSDVLIHELEIYAPEIINLLKDEGVAAYEKLPKKSIDYALMEKTSKACVVPVSFEWDDLGNWDALPRLLGKKSPENVEVGRHINIGTSDSIIYSTSGEELIVTLGIKDLVVIRDGNVTLVADRAQVDNIKKILQEIEETPDLKGLL